MARLESCDERRRALEDPGHYKPVYPYDVDWTTDCNYGPGHPPLCGNDSWKSKPSDLRYPPQLRADNHCPSIASGGSIRQYGRVEWGSAEQPGAGGKNGCG